MPEMPRRRPATAASPIGRQPPVTPGGVRRTVRARRFVAHGSVVGRFIHDRTAIIDRSVDSQNLRPVRSLPGATLRKPLPPVAVDAESFSRSERSVMPVDPQRPTASCDSSYRWFASSKRVEELEMFPSYASRALSRYVHRRTLPGTPSYGRSRTFGEASPFAAVNVRSTWPMKSTNGVRRAPGKSSPSRSRRIFGVEQPHDLAGSRVTCRQPTPRSPSRSRRGRLPTTGGSPTARSITTLGDLRDRPRWQSSPWLRRADNTFSAHAFNLAAHQARGRLPIQTRRRKQSQQFHPQWVRSRHPCYGTQRSQVRAAKFGAAVRTS